MTRPTRRTVPRSGKLDARLRKDRIRASLFGKPSARVKVQRFTLLERLGSGSMGEVYAAYDDRLDRKCAIKLVRGTFDAASKADERLLREAQTLARLSHPNVVHVYDAGVFEDQVYIAMEFIRGRTIARWLESVADLRPRERIRAILGKFIAAGRGLEAAHDADLIHRDFKPDNVMVGDDGRVRVVDFGLARQGETPGDSTATPGRETGKLAARLASAPLARLTADGALIGTPAYMAPEVLRGEPVDQRSDQFSFCVALFEALHREAPFAGRDIADLEAAISSADLLASRPDKNVPVPVHRVLVRGLAADPGRRFGDMAALLSALEAWPKRRQRAWLAVAGVSATALIGALGYSHVQTPPPCADAAREIDRLWNDQRREEVRSAVVAVAGTYAAIAWKEQIQPRLDDYAGELKSMYHRTCLDRHEGRDSDSRSDRRGACLAERRVRLDFTLRGDTETGLPSAAELVQMLADLPPVADCDDDAVLASRGSLPSDPAARRQIQELRERLQEVTASIDAGRYSLARAAAGEVARRAEQLGHGPVWAEALLLHGRSVLEEAGPDAADAILERAARVGLESRMYATAVEAFARLVYARRDASARNSCVPRAASQYEPLARGLHRDSTMASIRGKFVYALLLNNIGTACKGQGSPGEARRYFERAVKVLDSDLPLAQNVELTAARQNLAAFIEDHDQRREQMERVVAVYETRLGRWHPRSLIARYYAVQFIADTEVAHELLEPACDGYERYHSERKASLIRCLHELALLAVERGQPGKALEHWQNVVARSTGMTDPLLVSRLAPAYALLHQNRPGAALQVFMEARKAMPEAPEQPWRWRAIVDAHLGMGSSQLALEQHQLAINQFEQARDALERLLTSNPNHMGYRRRLARAETALARSLEQLAD